MSPVRESPFGSSDRRRVKLWIDQHLSRYLVGWLRARYEVEVEHFRELELHEAEDEPAFDAAREAGVVVMTKDRDFVNLLERRGPPPQVLWITCGNTSNAALKRIFEAVLEEALELLANGEPLVEISDASEPPRTR